MMRKAEFSKIKNHILDFFDGDFEELKKQFEVCLKQEKNAYKVGEEMVSHGLFEVYFEDAEKFLRELYGENFDEKIYKTKNGEFRYKNGEVYVWTIYANKIAKAIEKMIKEAGL